MVNWKSHLQHPTHLYLGAGTTPKTGLQLKEMKYLGNGVIIATRGYVSAYWVYYPQIFRSTDYGNTWHICFEETTLGNGFGFTDIAILDVGVALASGCKASGDWFSAPMYIFKTTDFGNTWEKVAELSFGTNLFWPVQYTTMACDPFTCTVYATGWNFGWTSNPSYDNVDIIFRSTDWGASWSEFKPHGSFYFMCFKLMFDSNGKLWGDIGSWCFLSGNPNVNTSWKNSGAMGPVDGRWTCYHDDLMGHMQLTHTYQLDFSRDYTYDWHGTVFPPFSGNHLGFVTNFPGTTVYIIGETVTGRILRSPGDMDSWESPVSDFTVAQTLGSCYKIEGVCCWDANNGVLCMDGKIYRTTNQGVSWTYKYTI